MIPGRLNLFIKRGADYTLSVRLLQGEVVRVVADVVAGGDSIALDPKTPIQQSIAVGRKFLFGDSIVATLREEAAIGATTLLVNPIAFPIFKKTSGQVCADLTGCTARAQFRGKLQTATTPRTFTIEFDSDRLTGLLSLKLSNVQTALLPANILVREPITEDELQEREAQDKDYEWEVDIIYPGDRIETPLQGLLIVGSEVLP